MKGNRDFIDWEHQLASIIDKSNKNLLKLSSGYNELKRRHDSNSSSTPVLYPPPPPTQHPQHLSEYSGGDYHFSDVGTKGNRHENVQQNGSSVGPHQRAAMAAFHATKMNGKKLATRPISRSTEDDILRRLETRMNYAVERMVNERLKPFSIALDSLKDQFSVIADEVRGLNKGASTIAQTISSQERAIDLLRHDVDSRREFLRKMESQVLDQISWKTMTGSEISRLKQAMAEQRDGLETKPSFGDVKRSVESAKIDVSMSLDASVSSFQAELNSLKEHLEKKIASTIENSAGQIGVVKNAMIEQLRETERRCLELVEREFEGLNMQRDASISENETHKYEGENTITIKQMFQDEEFLTVLTQIVAKTVSNVRKKSECVKSDSCAAEKSPPPDGTFHEKLESVQRDVYYMKKKVVENMEPEMLSFKDELKRIMDREAQLESKKKVVEELAESKIDEKTNQIEMSLQSAISTNSRELESIKQSLITQKEMAEKLKTDYDALLKSCSLCPTKLEVDELLEARKGGTFPESIDSVRKEFDDKFASMFNTLTSQLSDESSTREANFERKLGMNQTHSESLNSGMELVKALDSKIQKIESVMNTKIQEATRTLGPLEERVQHIERNRAEISELKENMLKVEVIEDMIDTKLQETKKMVHTNQERQFSMEKCLMTVETNVSSIEELVVTNRTKIQESMKSDEAEVTSSIRSVENHMNLSIEELKSSVDGIQNMLLERFQEVIDLIPPIQGKMQILEKSAHEENNDRRAANEKLKFDVFAIQSAEGHLRSEIKDAVAKINECSQRLKKIEQNICGEISCRQSKVSTKTAEAETRDSEGSDVVDSISRLRFSLNQAVDVGRGIGFEKSTCRRDLVDETRVDEWKENFSLSGAGTSISQPKGGKVVKSHLYIEHKSDECCVSANKDGTESSSGDEIAKIDDENGASCENNSSNLVPGSNVGDGTPGFETMASDCIDESVAGESFNFFDGSITSEDLSQSKASAARISDFRNKRQQIIPFTRNDSNENSTDWINCIQLPSKQKSQSNGGGNSSCGYLMLHSDPPVNALKTTDVDTPNEDTFIKDAMTFFSNANDCEPRSDTLEVNNNKLLCPPKDAKQSNAEEEQSDASIPESIDEILDTSDSMSSNLLVSPNGSPIDNDCGTTPKNASVQVGLRLVNSERKESPIGSTKIDDLCSRSRGIVGGEEDGNDNSIHSSRQDPLVGCSTNDESCTLAWWDDVNDLSIGLSNPQKNEKSRNVTGSNHNVLLEENIVADEYLLLPEDMSDSESGGIRSFDEILSCDISAISECNKVAKMKRISMASNHHMLESKVHRGWDKLLWEINSTGLVLRDSASPLDSMSNANDIGNTRDDSDDGSYGSSGFESEG